MEFDLTLLDVDYARKPALEQLMIDYFSEIDPSKIISSPESTLDYPYLNLYWKDENRKALFIEFDGKIIGFVLVNDWVINKRFNAQYSIAEFYIIPEYRRNGIGSQIAQILFERYTGKWEIRQNPNNQAAINFWRTCIATRTGEKISETLINGVVVQNFTTDHRAGSGKVSSNSTAI